MSVSISNLQIVLDILHEYREETWNLKTNITYLEDIYI